MTHPECISASRKKRSTIKKASSVGRWATASGCGKVAIEPFQLRHLTDLEKGSSPQAAGESLK